MRFYLLLRCSLSSLLFSPLSLLCALPRLLLHMISLPVNFYHTITNAPPALRSASLCPFVFYNSNSTSI